MVLETERLLLRLLNIYELELYVRNDGSLQELMCLEGSRLELPFAVSRVLSKVILPKVRKDVENYAFYNPWILVCKKKNAIVGDILFKGPPDANGQVEIGYGTYDSFQNQGFMTEAVQEITRWLKEETEVSSIIAETFPDNTASFRVLEKSIFTKYKESDGSLWWKRELSS